MAGDAALAGRHSGRLRLPALARCAGPAGALYREGDRTRAAARHGRRAAGDQRADPLFAERQSLYRARSWPAELLPGLLLLLWHLAIRWRRQDRGGMDRAWRAGVGFLEPRSAPLHRLCDQEL